jgi:hypothetical protein
MRITLLAPLLLAGLTGCPEKDCPPLKVTLVKKPGEKGDTLALCVPDEVAWEGIAGELAGKPVTIQGLFQGEFCGHKP